VPIVEDRPAEHVARLTLDRPGRRNALSLDDVRTLAQTWRRLDSDPEVRVVILTGAAQTFCSGIDLASFSREVVAASDTPEHEQQVWATIAAGLLCNVRSRKPVVSAVQGICYGAGMELVGATDIRIASTSARFALPEVTRGFLASGGSLTRLPRQIPYARAMEILLTGRPFSASELLACGFLNSVVEPDQVMPQTLDTAARIAANSPAAVQLCKVTVVDGLARDLDASFAAEQVAGREILQSADAAEGALAFIEHRSPRWLGH
jgi:enoyl-CoA hydratase